MAEVETSSNGHSISTILQLQTKLSKFWNDNRKSLKILFYGILAAAYVAYFVYALVYDFEENTTLLILTVIAICLAAIYIVQRHAGQRITIHAETVYRQLPRKYLRW